MICTELIKLKTGTALGVKIEFGAAPLILIKAEKGFAMCGYLNMDVANKFGDCAVVAKGVRNFEDLLNAKVIEISNKAKELGISKELSIREALERMF